MSKICNFFFFLGSKDLGVQCIVITWIGLRNWVSYTLRSSYLKQGKREGERREKREIGQNRLQGEKNPPILSLELI